MTAIAIRPEEKGDEIAIRDLTRAAFDGTEWSDGSEPAIIDRLRRDGDLALSLVAEAGGAIVGHIAFSPVAIGDGSSGWFGLGPVSVRPDMQKRGIGAMLVRQGIELMKRRGARGIVLLGDPAYYGRFGFAHDPQLSYPGPPAEYFQRLVLGGDIPKGVVTYAPAFG